MFGIVNYVNLANGVLSAYKHKTEKHMESNNPKKVAMYISIYYSINPVATADDINKHSIKESVRRDFGTEIEYLKENGYKIRLYQDSNGQIQILFEIPDGKFYSSTYPQCDIEW
jgi:hypothetical protein